MTVAERMRRRGWKLVRRGFYWITHVEGVRCLIDTASREGWLYTSWDKEQHFVIAASDNPLNYTAVAPYGIVDVAQRLAAAARKLAKERKRMAPL